MNDLFNYYKNALSNGLCDEYKGRWQAAGRNKEELVKLALSQQSLPHLITYCNEGDGLSKEYILENFEEYINGHVIANADGVDGYTYSLYTSFNGIFSLSTDICALMWCRTPRIEIKRCKCPILYVGAKSSVDIIAEGYNSIVVYLFDTSKVVLEDMDENSSVTIYKYSDKCKVERGKFCLCKVKEFQKKLRL